MSMGAFLTTATLPHRALPRNSPSLCTSAQLLSSLRSLLLTQHRLLIKSPIRQLPISTSPLHLKAYPSHLSSSHAFNLSKVFLHDQIIGCSLRITPTTVSFC